LTTLALIPARSGSKGIPGKNVRMFAGRPLLAWATKVGRKVCDRAVVSTDDPTYAAAGRVDVILRPPGLATDETPMLPVIQHALKSLEPWRPDVVVLLQPTQPLRTPGHVRAALKLLEETGADSVVSVVEVPPHYRPEYVMTIHGVGCLHPYLANDSNPTRRQDAQSAYSRDGTVYAIRRQTIEDGSLYGQDCRPLLIPRGESVNLDTEEDWTMAEAMKRGA
jgi:CMP-N-acetylneuraminic acid synthetase